MNILQDSIKEAGQQVLSLSFEIILSLLTASNVMS